MTVWAEMQSQGLIEQGCLLKAGELVSSSFPGELKKHLAVAKQALVYIFRNVEKSNKGYNEAHMEVGNSHFSGYLLEPGLILICMCSYEANQQHLGAFIETERDAFLQLAAG